MVKLIRLIESRASDKALYFSVTVNDKGWNGGYRIDDGWYKSLKRTLQDKPVVFTPDPFRWTVLKGTVVPLDMLFNGGIDG